MNDRPTWNSRFLKEPHVLPLIFPCVTNLVTSKQTLFYVILQWFVILFPLGPACNLLSLFAIASQELMSRECFLVDPLHTEYFIHKICLRFRSLSTENERCKLNCTGNFLYHRNQSMTTYSRKWANTFWWNVCKEQ